MKTVLSKLLTGVVSLTKGILTFPGGQKTSPRISPSYAAHIKSQKRFPEQPTLKETEHQTNVQRKTEEETESHTGGRELTPEEMKKLESVLGDAQENHKYFTW